MPAGGKSRIIFKFAKTVKAAIRENKKIIFACIGSDRSTGDSLGPLVGHMLTPRIRIHDEFEVVGTLKEPLHAMNMGELLEKYSGEDYFMVAIDASLGRSEEVGNIVFRAEGLRPGAGVGKNLGVVGHVSIYGIVNVGSALGMENMVLQCTRLGLVYEMAQEIVTIIMTGIYLSKSDNKLYMDLVETGSESR